MLTERGWAKKKNHIPGYNLHKNLENANQSTVTATNPCVKQEGPLRRAKGTMGMFTAMSMVMVTWVSTYDKHFTLNI